MFRRILNSSLLFFFVFSIAQFSYANTPISKDVQELVQQQGLDPSQLVLTPKLNIPVILHRSGHKNFTPEIPKNVKPVSEIKNYDVIIIGGGPAGLTSAVYLTDEGKSVLLLEREDEVGGLASATGSAYSGGPAGIKQYNIFRHIGMGDYIQKYSIYDPIDSYLWNGEMYDDVWEEHALEKLPASFELFKVVLLELAKQDYTTRGHPNAAKLDGIYMDVFLIQMPQMASKMKAKEVQVGYQKFLQDRRLDPENPMKDVIDFLDLYGRSALGGPTSKVSARQYCNFYVSEMRKRFTGSIGTGVVKEALVKTLYKGSRDIQIRTSAPVAKIVNRRGGVTVTYLKDGQVIEARGRKAIFAAPLFVAVKVIENIEKLDPEKTQAINEIEMTDYSVHEIHVKGHPYRGAYDLWVRNSDYSDYDPTDIILGRWMDSDIKGYAGMRSFEKDPQNSDGIYRVYDPRGEVNKTNFTDENSLARVDFIVDFFIKTLGPYVEKSGQKIEVTWVKSSRWANSINVVGIDYLKKEHLLRRAVGNIEFANNNIVTPELETAMELGFDATQQVLKKIR